MWSDLSDMDSSSTKPECQQLTEEPEADVASWGLSPLREKTRSPFHGHSSSKRVKAPRKGPQPIEQLADWATVSVPQTASPSPRQRVSNRVKRMTAVKPIPKTVSVHEEAYKLPPYFENYKLLNESTPVFKYYGRLGKRANFMATASPWFACEAAMHKPKDSSQWHPIARYMQITVKHKVLRYHQLYLFAVVISGNCYCIWLIRKTGGYFISCSCMQTI